MFIFITFDTALRYKTSTILVLSDIQSVSWNNGISSWLRKKFSVFQNRSIDKKWRKTRRNLPNGNIVYNRRGHHYRTFPHGTGFQYSTPHNYRYLDSLITSHTSPVFFIFFISIENYSSMRPIFLVWRGLNNYEWNLQFS
jgi:hypothetical protein